MRFRERSRLHDEVRGEATGADGEAAARCPGPAKVIGEGGRTEQQVFGGDVAASYWKTMPAGLSWLREVHAWLRSSRGQAD